MSRLYFFAFALLLASLTAVNPIAIDTMMPAMPMIADALATDAASVQYTLSAYLVGIGIGQLVHGPVSDRVGRRPIALVGIVLFALSSAGCARASSVEMLFALRVLQGFSACAGLVMARAIVRDRFERNVAAEVLAYVGVFHSLAPLTAPIFGASLAVAYGWEATFWAMAIYAAVVSVIAWFALPETHRQTEHARFGVLAKAANFAHILRNPVFRGYLGCMAIAYAGMFSFLAGSPFVLITFMGIDPERYGVLTALIMVGHILASFSAARLVRRFGIDRLLGLGVLLTLAGGATMAGLAWLGIATVAAVMLPMFVYMLGFGNVSPTSAAAALQPFPTIAGTASSLFGFVQTMTATVVVELTGLFHDGTQLPMTTGVGVCGALAALLYLYVRAVRRRGEVAPTPEACRT
ncbi:MAG: multidrug effflux MFS transporter [Alphaproteobacteria bacterium]|nr:multidrug effflux MFS transporter [Alphaproteobacteria bacterium]